MVRIAADKALDAGIRKKVRFKIARVKYSSRLQVSLTIYRVDEKELSTIFASCIHTAVCS